ncbi:hypothetical protein NBRC110019_22660 [Neptunitalea chrysea]|uniref:Uncharacterized protein n=1 Tax=Neptunitalea chrysea TaxID=1647581 RepID=A0A9W6EVQ6_9FLAO|nr:hypothetical protein [Neptunitalea chrysea]GLB53226.1 hypothetical protein NBRC110019_22660 [Neptunitalea chrysea]
MLGREDIDIERVYIPMRDLSAAAESRRNVTRKGLKNDTFKHRMKHRLGFKRRYAGGVSRTKSFDDGEQEAVLSNQLYNLILSLSNHSVPVTLIRFPKSVKNAEYLYGKLGDLVAHIKYEHFKKVYDKTAMPNLVNTFNKLD